jgi:CMP-N,N'-diacetyllegionaminic acid synthase
MYKKKKIVCIIPARAGSKGIRNKNISKILGKPLIFFAIRQAMSSKYIDKIIFSTDSIKYANYAKKLGVNVEKLRPKKYAQDNSRDIDLFRYELLNLKKQNFYPDIYVNLRPTSPMRSHKDIDNAIKKLVNNIKYDSIRSVTENNFVIQKTWFVRKNSLINTVSNSSKIEEWNLPRQELEKSFIQTGSIDIGRTDNIIIKNSMTGKKIMPFIEEFFCDIDKESDLLNAENLAKKTKKLYPYL